MEWRFDSVLRFQYTIYFLRLCFRVLSSSDIIATLFINLSIIINYIYIYITISKVQEYIYVQTSNLHIKSQIIISQYQRTINTI